MAQKKPQKKSQIKRCSPDLLSNYKSILLIIIFIVLGTIPIFTEYIPKIRLIKIRSNSPVVACNGQIVLEKTIHEKRNGHYISRPTVFLVSKKNDKNKPDLYLEFDTINFKTDKSVTVIGKLNGFYFKGTGGLGPTRKILEVKLVNKVDNFWQLKGSMQWQYKILGSKKFLDLGNTPVEMYWIYDYPGPMYKKGVWIEVLQKLTDICKSIPLKERVRSTVIKKIVCHFHRKTGIKYGSEYRYYAETIKGGGFNLKAFLSKLYDKSQCYDQAGAMQAIFGAIGVYSDFAIITDNLRLSDDVSVLSDTRLEDRLMGEHAFCLYRNLTGQLVVADTCFGGYSNLPLDEYLNKAFGIKTALGLHQVKVHLNKEGKISDVHGSKWEVSDVFSDRSKWKYAHPDLCELSDKQYQKLQNDILNQKRVVWNYKSRLTGFFKKKGYDLGYNHFCSGKHYSYWEGKFVNGIRSYVIKTMGTSEVKSFSKLILDAFKLLHLNINNTNRLLVIRKMNDNIKNNGFFHLSSSKGELYYWQNLYIFLNNDYGDLKNFLKKEILEAPRCKYHSCIPEFYMKIKLINENIFKIIIDPAVININNCLVGFDINQRDAWLISEETIRSLERTKVKPGKIILKFHRKKNKCIPLEIFIVNKINLFRSKIKKLGIPRFDKDK